MQPPDSGNALIPWTLGTMAIPHLPYLTAAKQFRRPFQVRVSWPNRHSRLRSVLHNTWLTPHRFLCLGGPSGTSMAPLQQGVPRAFEEWPCHPLPEVDKDMGREPIPKADTVFQLFSHLVQDQEANMVCGEEYSFASLSKHHTGMRTCLTSSPLFRIVAHCLWAVGWPWGEGWKKAAGGSPPLKSSTVTTTATVFKQGPDLLRDAVMDSAFPDWLHMETRDTRTSDYSKKIIQRYFVRKNGNKICVLQTSLGTVNFLASTFPAIFQQITH